MALGLATAGVILTACHGRQTMLDPAGDGASHIDLVWRSMLVVCGGMYVLVMGFLAWALWRAKRRRTDQMKPPEAGHTRAEPVLERSLTGWSALIVAGLVTLTTVSFLVDRSLAEVGPNPVRIKMTANQWWWDIEYFGAAPSDNLRTANVLHLPLGRPVVIELHARDVIHSFWAPNLTGKTDLIPGRTNYIAFTPKRLGVFRGQCAEFCGLEHALMAFDVHVDTPQAYEAWRAAQAQPSAFPVDPGQQAGLGVFMSKACVMCHAIGGTDAKAQVGPDLTHLKSREHIAAGTLNNTNGDLKAWIADPQAIKPGTTMPRVPLTKEELQSVVNYLETLR